MLSWLAKKMIARNMARASAGDLDTQKSKALDRYLASTGDVLSQRAIGEGS